MYPLSESVANRGIAYFHLSIKEQYFVCFILYVHIILKVKNCFISFLYDYEVTHMKQLTYIAEWCPMHHFRKICNDIHVIIILPSVSNLRENQSVNINIIQQLLHSYFL